MNLINSCLAPATKFVGVTHLNDSYLINSLQTSYDILNNNFQENCCSNNNNDLLSQTNDNDLIITESIDNLDNNQYDEISETNHNESNEELLLHKIQK